MKKFGILFMLLISLTVSAQSDFDVAQEFMSKKGVKLVPNEHSTTRGTDTPYSIFNGSEGKGFCIVTNGKVIGYDTENTVDEDNMPCCLKEMLLDGYSKTAKTRGDDYTPDWWTPRNVTPIKPLLTTKWSQGSPYNNILQKSGICTVIAFTQIMHYFKVPQTYADKTLKNGECLPMTVFNHDLMLDEYKKGGYTDEQAYEVAKFIYYYYNIDSYGIEEYYGMETRSVQTNEKNHYIEIDEYLEQGIPIWACGEYNNVGHAYVIDGRDSEGRYHINFGWGGGSNGYYVLADCKEHSENYGGNTSVLAYVSTDLWMFYVIIPKLFSWSYTTDFTKPFIYVSSSDDVYNLQGIKVGNSLEGLPKGVYIQGGKKYIVK